VSFEGFPRGAERFWTELASEMSREWFAANKARYEDQWVRPMQALLDDVRAKLSPAYRGVGLAEPKVMRIHRDVRFAKDKSPYKTHIAGLISAGRDDSAPQRPAACYISFGMEEYAGAGLYHLDTPQLARWRKALLDPRKGPQIAKLAEGKEIAAHEVTARVPRGFPADHPRAELARHKGLVVGFDDVPRGLIYKPGLVAWLAEQARAAAPLVTWLVKNVA